MRQEGLTLIEVVIAVGVLAVAVLALSGLQRTSFGASSQAATQRELVRLAEAELDLQRVTPGLANNECVADHPGMTCNRSAPTGMWEGAVEAFELVTVTVEGDDGAQVSLQALVRRP